MNKKMPEIKEEVEEIQKQLKAEKDVRKKQRIQTLYLIKSQQAKSRIKIAELLSVHRNSVSEWLGNYEEGGMRQVLIIEKAPGKVPRMNPDIVTQLKKKLDAEGFNSYGEIKDYLSSEHNIELSYSRVHSFVRYRLSLNLLASLKKDYQQIDKYVAEFESRVTSLVEQAKSHGGERPIRIAGRI